MTESEGQKLESHNIKEIKANPLYSGQWIAAEVTKFSKDGSPDEGIILSTGSDDIMVAGEARILIQNREPKPKIAFFFSDHLLDGPLVVNQETNTKL